MLQEVKIMKKVIGILLLIIVAMAGFMIYQKNFEKAGFSGNKQILKGENFTYDNETDTIFLIEKLKAET